MLPTALNMPPMSGMPEPEKMLPPARPPAIPLFRLPDGELPSQSG